MGTFEWYLNNPVINWGTGIMVVKDLNHRFVASNNVLSDFSGYKPEDMVGLSDDDMPWSDSKSIYVDHEDDIIKGMRYDVIEPLAGIIKSNVLTTKCLIHDKNGKPAGIQANANVIRFSLEYGNLAGTAKTMKINDYSGYNLTSTEAKVLFFALKGYKRQRVSDLIGISTSSFDFHILNIKKKFQVATLTDVIDICYKNSFHEMVPFQIMLSAQ